MRNMVAPASEIPGEECEPKLTSGVPGPSKHFHSERQDILSDQSGTMHAGISHMLSSITAMIHNPAFPINSAHLLTLTAKNTSGILFRLCRNIRERHPGYTLCYFFNHSTGAFTGSMFTLRSHPKSTVSFKRQETGTETESHY